MFIPRCKGMATFSAGKKYGIPRSRHFFQSFLQYPYLFIMSARHKLACRFVWQNNAPFFLHVTLTALILVRKQGDFV